MSREYSEDQLVQGTTADFLEKELGWESVYAHNTVTLGVTSTFGRENDDELACLNAGAADLVQVIEARSAEVVG